MTLWEPDAAFDPDKVCEHQLKAQWACKEYVEVFAKRCGRQTKEKAPRPDQLATRIARVQRSGVKAVRRQRATGEGPLQDRHLRMPGRRTDTRANRGEKSSWEAHCRRLGAEAKLEKQRNIKSRIASDWLVEKQVRKDNAKDNSCIYMVNHEGTEARKVSVYHEVAGDVDRFCERKGEHDGIHDGMYFCSLDILYDFSCCDHTYRKKRTQRK